MSASESWRRHYFSCPICQVHEWDRERDRFCPEGQRLRDDSLARRQDLPETPR